MAMQFYTSPEQIMRDRAEFARKNISRGRNVVVLSCADGVLLVAENVSSALHKVYELYDRIGFAAVGKYNEFENLRTAGVRMADLRGYSYDRRDVNAASLAKAYAQTLGAIFSEQTKPFEVEICVAGVGVAPEEDELYRLTFDGSINDEPGYLAMGGDADRLKEVLAEGHDFASPIADAFALALRALSSDGNGSRRELTTDVLEVAVLERARPGRAFRRIEGLALDAIMPGPAAAEPEPAEAADETPDPDES
ncbi:proteasome subunit alpha [Glycomyces sp. TRM65418]|uniref:proteasome subunit alpha n=1 Tax=Glycomyces sp. TRM65418 TaxID=2867006 RepID=UPI001CE50354|nr:proteasome subunit alpha [Glycomyces sp. TRM65418]MCC3763029.1 proteasome subunit alpha [Glycomyces sp. TRM65418]QZD57043.1 proteasome subunit alpha [Glycomyces sp. TRM65418]